jgi:CRISPR/Cas system CSM-associated protein Csm3 (group 7 of RAMP superfamily)
MSNTFWSANTSRKVLKRIVIEGDLVLQTPTHFGGGDSGDIIDMTLLVDSVSGKPLLSGSTLAGALRSYLLARERGERAAIENESNTLAAKLFGAPQMDYEGRQSALIIDDALGELPRGVPGVEIRDGVRLDSRSRTAMEKKKFDLELWPAGTQFSLHFELMICENDDEYMLKQALATALVGLSNGQIALGKRKSRGYGRLLVKRWSKRTYDFSNGDDLIAWIADDRDNMGVTGPAVESNEDIANLLGVELVDVRSYFTIDADFQVAGSLLIRSTSGVTFHGPDQVHLRSWQPDGTESPVLSGTSIAGTLRARAGQIINSLAADKNKGNDLLSGIFGILHDDESEGQRKKPNASRLEVDEVVIEDCCIDLIQNRVCIDRFTGGAAEGKLFNEQPVFGGKVKLTMRLVNPAFSEIGILLLLLKDLWTEDLPLGGEASIGRGRLSGEKAKLVLFDNGVKNEEWLLEDLPDGIKCIGNKEKLEEYVLELNTFLGVSNSVSAGN